MLLHLDAERLAALADAEPTADEAAHLLTCERCVRERAAYRELVSLAARERRATLAAPITDWSALAAALDESGSSGRHGRARARLRGWMQAAAAVLLALGGAVVGRATANAAPKSSLASADGQRDRSIGTASPVSDTARGVVSVSDALALMQRAEGEYRLAAAYVAAHDTTSRGSDAELDRYRTRLAALDRVSDAALAAVNEAPSDPIINQYLISARTARAVTLEQLNSSLPAGVKLASY